MANIEKVENLRAIYIKIGGEKCISLVCFTLAEVFQDFPLLSSSIYLFGGGAYGRAPKGPYQSSPLKGDGGLISRAP